MALKERIKEEKMKKDCKSVLRGNWKKRKHWRSSHMKRILSLIVCIVLIIGALAESNVFAAKGVNGYEGGISSGQSSSTTSMEYREVCYITGAPIIFTGTLTIKTSNRQGNVRTTYTYNLKNIDRNATLTRTIVYDTKKTEKENGQVIEETSLNTKPTETIRIDNTIYTLSSYEFTNSNIIDPQPAIDYYAGNFGSKKVYRVGTTQNGGTITVSTTGSYYGYDQYWSTAEVITLKHYIECERRSGDVVDRWGGEAQETISSTMTKLMTYEENEPHQISFEGGYVEMQKNSSILEYSCQLPEFDKDGISTDNMLTYRDTMQIETYPVYKRMPVPNISHLRGHWAEKDILALFSMEVLKGDAESYNPEAYMTRAEFTAAIVQAAREVPQVSSSTSSVTNIYGGSSKKKQEEVVSPFIDVSTDNKYFAAIYDAYKRGLISGNGDNTFAPDQFITVAQAITVFIRAIGLEGLAPNPTAVTTFKDNDEIPSYAKNAVYVAQDIGLIYGDERGYLKPNEYITNARAAALVNRFIDYMRTGIRSDYREHIINY